MSQTQQVALPTTLDPLSEPTASSVANWTERYQTSMMNTFGAPRTVFVRGEGVYVWDADGRRYLDLLAGLAVNALGHAHPLVLSAITSQLSQLGHVSNFFATPAQIALAERLTAMTGTKDARVFFTNSGTEANEAAFKITRRTGRQKIIAMIGGFHGRSVGALSITHQPRYREPFAPLLDHVEFVPYGDEAALRDAVDDACAAVVLEAVQGENGVIAASASYLDVARELTTRHGALLWIDEVQTGIGRTGEWLAHRPGGQGWSADLITLAKGLGNGFPIGACIATGAAAELLGPGSHGTTFGGNPVGAMAGLAVLTAIERDGLLSQVRSTGEQLATAIENLRHPMIKQVRGRGLLRAVVLAQPKAVAVVDHAMTAGFVLNAPRPDVIRLAPPLIITAAQLDDFVAGLPELIDRAAVG